MPAISGPLLLGGAAILGLGYLTVRDEVKRKLEILPLIMILLIIGYIVIIQK